MSIKTNGPLLLAGFMVVAASLTVVHAQTITSSKTLKIALKNAKTAKNHLCIAAYYRERATKMQEIEKREEEWANYYREHRLNFAPKIPPYQTCEQLAGYYRFEANKALAQAELQTKIAQEIELNPKPKAQEAEVKTQN
jgi:hypothetical protein